MGFVPLQQSEFGDHYKETYMTTKERKKYWSHRILLFTPDMKRENLYKLTAVTNCYEHNEFDFEFNMRRMIKCLRQNIGADNMAFYTIGQNILFRVVPDQEPFKLPLIHFMFNYTLIMTRVLLKCDMTNWTPWLPVHFSDAAIMNEYDNIIYEARGHNNHRAVCDRLADAKYWLNMVCNEIGDHLGYSISNYEFAQMAKRDPEAMGSITCSFEKPKKSHISALEKLRASRAKSLMDKIKEQDDLCISTYARGGLMNLGQFTEFATHMGYKPDMSGNTIPVTAHTNLLMGLHDARAYVVDARGGRKAESIKKNVSDAGTFERRAAMVTSSIRYVDLDPENECNSRHFRKRYIGSNEDLHMLNGRVGTLDPNSDELFIIDYKNDEFNLIGKTVYLKTPITCTHKNRKDGVICHSCYGFVLAPINQDVHPGRISGLSESDQMEQNLLSSKHLLKTDTTTVDFSDNFKTYFENDNGFIHFDPEFVEDVINYPDKYKYLYLEFIPDIVKKMKDGEGAHYDRCFGEIVIYNAETDDREVIEEHNHIKLFLSPEFGEQYYLPAIAHNQDYRIHISIVDIIQDGDISTIFEFEPKNREMADPLLYINGVINNNSSRGIRKYKTYNECLDDLMPAFEAGGIHVPDVHAEMLFACMVFDSDDNMVDWTNPDPDYGFRSIMGSLMNNPSVMTSLLYTAPNPQIAGRYRTYEKTGVSDYDYFLG